MSLGQHLRTDEDADLVAADPLESRLQLALAPHAVSIDSSQRELRKNARNGFFYAFRSLADGLHFRFAGGAMRGHAFFGPAVMADQVGRAAMNRQMRIAALA